MCAVLAIPYRPFDKQRQFHYSPKKYRALIGGIGSGKTKAGVQEIFRICAKNPGVNGIVVAPTYRMLHDVTRLEFLAVCTRTPGLLQDFSKAEDVAFLATGNMVFFRSAEDPEKLRGPNVGWFYADESALMAEMAWNILIGRLRLNPALGWTTTTPKGKNWLYRMFGLGGEEHFMVRVSSRDNPYVPSDFVKSIERSYTSAFAAQEIDGEFVDMEGALFRRQWFTIVDVAPADCRRVRYWDLAATEVKKGNDPDHTAGALVGEKDGLYFVLDVRRMRGTPGQVEALVRQTAEVDGRAAHVWMEQEPGSSGVNTIDHYTRRVLVGFTFRGNRATGSKSERAMPLASQAEAGNVRIVRGAWNGALLDELESFPQGAHDDMVDACAGAFEKLARRGLPFGFVATPDAAKAVA